MSLEGTQPIVGGLNSHLDTLSQFLSDCNFLKFPDDNQEKASKLKNEETLHLTIPEERLSATHLPAIVEQVGKENNKFKFQLDFYLKKDFV
jgi:hypothetical protein